MTSPRTLTLSVTAVATAAALCACGGSSSRKSNGGSTPSTSASSAATSASGTYTPLPETQLGALAIAAADLPSGFSSTPHDKSDDDDPADQTKLAQCAGAKDTGPDLVASSYSPDFANTEVDFSSSAKSFKSQQDIDDDVALLQNPKVGPCYKSIALELLKGEKSVTVDKLDVTVTKNPVPGQSSIVALLSAQLTLTSEGKTTTQTFDEYDIKGTGVEVSLDVTSGGTRAPEALRNQIATALAAKVAKV